jgi:hypothetical protein
VLRAPLSLRPQQRIDPPRSARRQARHPCRARRLRLRRKPAARWTIPAKSREYPNVLPHRRRSLPAAGFPTRHKYRLARIIRPTLVWRRLRTLTLEFQSPSSHNGPTLTRSPTVQPNSPREAWRGPCQRPRPRGAVMTARPQRLAPREYWSLREYRDGRCRDRGFGASRQTARLRGRRRNPARQRRSPFNL